jgi:MFS family permease
MSHAKVEYHSPFNMAVLVAGLGFFIDAFDLFLFNVYRMPSLLELGLKDAELTVYGERLLSWQMAGMMLGGILTGIIADKKGRSIALYGSIALYSLANIANAFVQDINTYALIRFLAGVGLAGELGAGVTLVAESMSVKNRGYGTILVATLGALGAVCAGLAGDFMPWRHAFFAAGIAGFILLILRLKTMETSVFLANKNSGGSKGSLWLIVKQKNRLFKYFACILMGVPIWFSVGLLITLTPELAKEHALSGTKLSACFILFQIGIASGDLCSGILSQLFKSRKKILLGFMTLGIFASIWHFYNLYAGNGIVFTAFLMGLGCGYLSVFVTSTAEHFGTNLRVTVTATVTNFMRGAVIVLIPLHQSIQHFFGTSLSVGLMITGALVWSLAITAVILLKETFGRDLNFEEI